MAMAQACPRQCQWDKGDSMLVEGAIYRFNRTDELRYCRAARTKAGMDFPYPVQVNGTRLAGTHKNGRRYVLLYLWT
jgi:hypothetical protein